MPADDLPLKKSVLFVHPDEVLSDRELSIEDKRSLLASWVSDAFSVENSPSLRQLASGAVVRVDDIMAALKSLDEPRHEATFTGKQVARRRSRGSRNDDEPPPPAAGAGISSAWKVLIAMRQDGMSAASAADCSREISVGGRSAA